MLSLKNGGVAPASSKGPLLALMPPGVRSLFEGTVEPLPEVLRLRDELAQMAKLNPKVAAICESQAAKAALMELEEPVIDYTKDRVVIEWDSKPQVPAKKARKQQISDVTAEDSPQQHGPSWLATLLTQHTDCASVVVDFLGNRDALRSIGTTAPALRAEVKASLHRLKLKVRTGDGTPSVAWLKGFKRLQHLTIAGSDTEEQHQQLAADMVAAGLPARLQSFTYSGTQGDVCCNLLVNHAWPQLRCFNCYSDWLGPFLEAVRARPHAVFPQLQSLEVSELCGYQAGMLLTLLEPGAFPSLVSIGRPARRLYIRQGSAADATQHVALLRRLPAFEALELASNVAPFAGLITSGGFSNLKSVSLRFSPRPSDGHDPTSFFNALGSGALTRLHTLKIGYSFAPPDVLGDANVLPNSLPSLCDLYIATPMSAGLLGRIFAAAGPGLATINIFNVHTAPIAMRLLAENDYVWAPALKSLVLKPREPDELVVRLLALAEGGGLQNLARLKLEIPRLGPALTPGAALLLLLWLKREAKKALQGEGHAALWDVHGPFEQMMEDEFTQLNEAHRLIRKARGGSPVL